MKARSTALFWMICLSLPFSLLARERQTVQEKNKERILVGIVEKILGVSEIERFPQLTKARTHLGMRAFENDRFLTFKAARLLVKYKDEIQVEIGAQSSFECERIRAAPFAPESIYRFLYGLVHVQAEKFQSKHGVHVKTVNGLIRILSPSDLYLLQNPGQKDLSLLLANGKIEVTHLLTQSKVSADAPATLVLTLAGSIEKKAALDATVLEEFKKQTTLVDFKAPKN